MVYWIDRLWEIINLPDDEASAVFNCSKYEDFLLGYTQAKIDGEDVSQLYKEDVVTHFTYCPGCSQEIDDLVEISTTDSEDIEITPEA